MALGSSYQLIIQPYPAVEGGSTVADGWTLSAQHQMSVADTSVLYKGDGQMTSNNVTDIIDTVAGGGNTYYQSGQSGPALEANLSSVADVEVDAQGNLYIADGFYYGRNVV